MQVSDTLLVVSATVDDPNLVSAAGLVPLMALAEEPGLRALGDEHLRVPTDKGSNDGLKLAALVAGMAAGADGIDDISLLRHGAMGKVFDRPYAPSTLGSFLRAFTFGHVRQVVAVAPRFTLALAERTGLLGDRGDTSPGLLDLGDTIVEVHGYAKQGAGFGYSGVRGLNALLATVSTEHIAPVIAAQRLRKGSVGSCLCSGPTPRVLLAAPVDTATRAGVQVSITVRLDPAVRRAIAAIGDDAWEAIKYTDAIYDENTWTWISRAEVAEVPYAAYTSHKKSE